MAKPSLAYRIFRVVMFPGVILVFAVGWMLYVTGKKYDRHPSPALVRTDLNTPDEKTLPVPSSKGSRKLRKTATN